MERTLVRALDRENYGFIVGHDKVRELYLVEFTAPDTGNTARVWFSSHEFQVVKPLVPQSKKKKNENKREKMKPRKGLSSSMRASILALNDANSVSKNHRASIRKKERELPLLDATRLSKDVEAICPMSIQSSWPNDGGSFIQLSDDDWKSLRH